ncbi:MAG: DUF983 domain-containing protein [Chitinophagaceae bacterium]|nr:MAG: DUF983 domain-containing protein [Chitinophagaceae bacterium]
MQNSLQMQTDTSAVRKPSVLNVLKCKCPRCRLGDMFYEKNPYRLKSTLKMREQCEICGQAFDLEVGFYYGSSYVSYGLSILISVVFLAIYALVIGISLNDNRFFYWLVANAVLLISLQPILMREARSIWLAIFVPYNADWRDVPAKKPERINEDQKNNW